MKILLIGERACIRGSEYARNYLNCLAGRFYGLKSKISIGKEKYILNSYCMLSHPDKVFLEVFSILFRFLLSFFEEFVKAFYIVVMEF